MNEPGFDDQVTKLAESLHGPLILYARQWLPADAEDVVQEAFLRLLRTFRQSSQNAGETVDNPAAWLFRVVRNESVSRLRRLALIGRHKERIQAERKPWFEARPEKKAETDAEAEIIAEKIAEMPMELREVLVPRLWGSLSFQEIGEITETSQSTAHRRYHEALYFLKEQLK